MNLKLLLEKQEALRLENMKVNSLVQELNSDLLENSPAIMVELDKALRSNGYIFQDSLYVKYNDNETVSRVRLPLDARGTVFLKKYASKEEFNKSQFCSNDKVTDVLTLLSVLLEHIQDETL